ncbi:hypothetical protein lacNasYZ03_00370 [Lactobacillus nasalidis]|uniref:XRE family transcriptional regulator n=1 Tax=Lactobacillus nasalidis TaxID=2797258 RepID=A0ABQ3W283_9LACO|nr:hypothetical protein [Lactobacillus nasalidis]GHV98523.1 hypothetical protein lacNasYZ01_17050 [Lactobacillus nasalidis]GHW00018.1 hypothetical protein lacNasYZ02_14470 [Lactobacillus nasalidis]GHW00350.1 hypothetical protein lacNasYZ03_00370 [Lactobacillus nasalidis]
MNELEDARKALLLDDVNVGELANITGIPYQTIRNMRHKPELLERASWTRVETLAQLYDDLLSNKLVIVRGMFRQGIPGLNEQEDGEKERHKFWYEEDLSNSYSEVTIGIDDGYFEWSVSITYEKVTQADADKYYNGKPTLIRTVTVIPFLSKVSNYYYGYHLNEHDPSAVDDFKNKLANDFGRGFADKVMGINEMLNKIVKKMEREEYEDDPGDWY